MVGSGNEAQRGRRVIGRLRRDAAVLAKSHGLTLRSLQAERANVKRRYGVCFDDGSIRIRLRHARTGELLKYSSLVNTLCHELAHLKHFDHGPRFEALYQRILEYARRNGIYRPDPRNSAAGRRRGESEGIRLRQSSILPLARLGPPRPRVRQDPRPTLREDPRPKLPEDRRPKLPEDRRAKPSGAPEQLELFR